MNKKPNQSISHNNSNFSTINISSLPKIPTKEVNINLHNKNSLTLHNKNSVISNINFCLDQTQVPVNDYMQKHKSNFTNNQSKSLNSQDFYSINVVNMNQSNTFLTKNLRKKYLSIEQKLKNTSLSRSCSKKNNKKEVNEIEDKNDVNLANDFFNGVVNSLISKDFKFKRGEILNSIDLKSQSNISFINDKAFDINDKASKNIAINNDDQQIKNKSQVTENDNNNKSCQMTINDDEEIKRILKMNNKQINDEFDKIYHKGLLGLFKILDSSSFSEKQVRSEYNILKKLEEFSNNLDNRKVVEMKESIYFLKGLLDYSSIPIKKFKNICQSQLIKKKVNHFLQSNKKKQLEVNKSLIQFYEEQEEIKKTKEKYSKSKILNPSSFNNISITKIKKSKAKKSKDKKEKITEHVRETTFPDEENSLEIQKEIMKTEKNRGTSNNFNFIDNENENKKVNLGRKLIINNQIDKTLQNLELEKDFDRSLKHKFLKDNEVKYKKDKYLVDQLIDFKKENDRKFDQLTINNYSKIKMNLISNKNNDLKLEIKSLNSNMQDSKNLFSDNKRSFGSQSLIEDIPYAFRKKSNFIESIKPAIFITKK